MRLRENAEVPARVTLIGDAASHLPAVVVGIRRMAEMGLGLADAHGSTLAAEEPPKRPALTLDKIVAESNGTVVYDSATGRFRSAAPLSLCYSADDVASRSIASDSVTSQGDVTNLSVEFVTPFRLKIDGKIASRIPADKFLLALVRRVNHLACLSNGREAIDTEAVENLSAGIVADDSRLRLVHVRRYSARQRRRMEWPGLIGTLRLRGSTLPQLMPLLRFGEIIQVGKGTALGFGRYRLLIPH